MRRTRRHKFLQISLLFLTYSIIHVYSQNSQNDLEAAVTNGASKLLHTNGSHLTKLLTSNSSIITTATIASTTVTTENPTTTTNTHKTTSATKTRASTTTSRSNPTKATLSSKSQHKDHLPVMVSSPVPTFRPKRTNCTPPAIEQVTY